ncbi:uncharacterized protein LOC123685493 [Harmonia axyridis]|uniref:uncharacterized protein LOC123685493 n=1 Tax=Harmonia axyridis TaxID=115357 RepID=UPI001E27761C|nr:uncharacterized protein LOC123685493 [Harmonia axyridis]
MVELCIVFHFIFLVCAVNSASIDTEKMEAKRDACVDKVNAISSNIAVKAAQEAKAAENAQAPAGAAAAHQIKEELAEKAIEAAKAAQASLAGKIALVEELTREKDALRVVIAELLQSKAELERAINAELKALSEEKGLEKVLTTALHVAESTASDADHSVKGVGDELMEKEKVLHSALHRTQELSKEEQMARVDLDNTKLAARKAVQAATEAKANAMRNKRWVILNFS